MPHTRTSLIASLAVTALVIAFVGCGHEPTKQRGLSEARVGQLATKYRDDWVTKNAPPEATILARGSLQSVERLTNGWHVVFLTSTGHDPATPEGIHDYYLHVYPDMLT